MPFTQQSAHRIIEALVKNQVLKIGGPISSGRGKPSPSVQISDQGHFSIGLSILNRGIYFCVIDLPGNILVKKKIEVENKYQPQTLKTFKTIIFDELRALKMPVDKILGCGVYLPTYISSMKNGEYLYQAYGEWPTLPDRKIFSNLLKVPVLVENTTNNFALAELMTGEHNYKSFVYLPFEFGYGGGLVWNGELMTGGFGNAGETGRLYTDEERKKRPAI